MRVRILVSILGLTVATSLALAEPPHGYGATRVASFLQASPPSEAPISLIAVVPLNQSADATLELCKQLAQWVPRPDNAKYSCRNGTVDEIARSSTKAAPHPPEKGVVAVLHMTEASGEHHDLDGFELLNVSGLFQPGVMMVLCQHFASSTGSHTTRDESRRVTFRDVHYTCEVDNSP